MKYTIKDVMNQLDMSVHTIRHYCDNGLVPNVQYDKNGYRIFDEESINWLKCARSLRNSGMSIPEIKYYFDLCTEGTSTFDERHEILKQLAEKTAAQLEAAEYRNQCIQNMLKHCEDIKAGKYIDDCNPLNW